MKQELAERQGEVESLKGDVARLEQALQEAPALLADKDAQLAQLQVPYPTPSISFPLSLSVPLPSASFPPFFFRFPSF